MSALPPKADMFSVELDVCFVPLADVEHLPHVAIVHREFALRAPLREGLSAPTALDKRVGCHTKVFQRPNWEPGV